MAGGTFKARVGFEAKTEAEVEVSKFSTASWGANSNIENLDINNSAAGLIALIGLTTLAGLTILTNLISVENVVTKVIKILLGHKVIMAAIRF